MANQNIFNSIQVKKPNRNVFDLSHDVKLTLDMGQLVPIMVQEAIPGDLFTIGCDSLIRFSPMVFPVMHRFDVTMHYFFVSNRLAWSGWEKWLAGDETLVHPTLRIDGGVDITGTLADYMGLPSAATDYRVSALPFAAYQMIYNEYYRDQNLVPEVNFNLVSGEQPEGPSGNSADLLTLRRRAWTHDYFTSALPFAQKGEAVQLPLGQLTDVPVRVNTGIGIDPGDPVDFAVTVQPAGTPDTVTVVALEHDGVNPIADRSLYADMSNADLEATTINDLRRAYALQRFLEKLARGGSRYSEIVYAHFGVRSSDSRLQRPEYITGVKTPVLISEVLNTTGAEGGLPQGNMAGHGVASTQGGYESFFCQEHGFIIGIMSVMPLPAYMQGVQRHYFRSDRYSYFWPDFANIGEQPVMNQEIYIDSADREGTFGYVPRYAEYRYAPNRVAGQFKTTLDSWHLGRKFGNQPMLNREFIELNPADTKRIFAVTDETNSLYATVLNKIRAVRSIPKFGTPMF